MDRKISVLRPASGMASALHPVMLACDGTWVGHGSGDADRDGGRRARPHPGAAGGPAATRCAGSGSPRSRRRGTTTAWPTAGSGRFATSPSRVRDSPRETGSTYREVNRLFADAVLEEVGTEPAFIFIQDFHFCLLPRMLKNAHPRPDRRPVLAHSLAQPRGLPHLSLGRGASRWTAGQRPARLPRPLSLPELSGHGRSRNRSASRPRSIRDPPRRAQHPDPAVPDQHRLRGPDREGQEPGGRGRDGTLAPRAEPAG